MSSLSDAHRRRRVKTQMIDQREMDFDARKTQPSHSISKFPSGGNRSPPVFSVRQPLQVKPRQREKIFPRAYVRVSRRSLIQADHRAIAQHREVTVTAATGLEHLIDGP